MIRKCHSLRILGFICRNSDFAETTLFALRLSALIYILPSANLARNVPGVAPLRAQPARYDVGSSKLRRYLICVSVHRVSLTTSMSVLTVVSPEASLLQSPHCCLTRCGGRSRAGQESGEIGPS